MSDAWDLIRSRGNFAPAVLEATEEIENLFSTGLDQKRKIKSP